MKWTTTTIGGLAALALLAVALWPDGANVKLTPQAVAQAPAATKADPPKKDEPAKSKDDNNAATEAALSKQVPAEFIETPLADVIHYLQDLTGVEFYINWKKLEVAGVAKDSPITINLKKVRVDMMLDLVLAQAGDDAAYVLRDGIVVVSSAEDLENATEVRVYNCRDLLKLASPVEGASYGVPARIPSATPAKPVLPGGAPAALPPAPKPVAVPSGAAPPGAAAPIEPAPAGSAPASAPAAEATPPGTGGAPGSPQPPGGIGGGPGIGGLGGALGAPSLSRPPATDEASQRAERLMHIVTTAVAPDSWQESGGFGSIGEYSGLLVVNHNARTHRQIEKVLAMLREAAARDAEVVKPAAAKH